MITVTSTSPLALSSGLYLDDSITVTFSNQLEASYLNMTYFKLYRTDALYKSYYELINITVSQTGNVVTVNPSINLTALNYYMLLIMGNTSGVTDIGGDKLASNYVLKFQAGEEVRPVTLPVETASDIPVVINGSSISEIPRSTDLFSLSGDSVPISVTGISPADLSLGVSNIDKITFTFNDTVNSAVSKNALTGYYNDIPFDMNPFSDHTITPTAVTVSGSTVSFTIPEITTDVNKEYHFTLLSNSVKGVNKQAYNTDDVEMKFTGALTPILATPDQIINRLKGFDDSVSINITKYEIYKLILEKSKEIISKIKVDISDDMAALLNRLIVCMILKDIITMGAISRGAIKSRELLATKVEYYNFDPSSATGALDDCIKDTINDLQGTLGSNIRIGIKSGNNMVRPTKDYQVYR
jgi:hypothetical protein